MPVSHEPDILIVGVGHPLMGDDALGVEIIRRLEEDGLLPRVRLFYAGSAPVDILGELSGINKLIVIDALHGVPSGEIIKKRFLPRIPGEQQQEVHTHGMGLFQTLCMARELMPELEIVIVGIGTEQPATPGMPLSPILLERIPALIQIIKNEVNG